MSNKNKQKNSFQSYFELVINRTCFRHTYTLLQVVLYILLVLTTYEKRRPTNKIKNCSMLQCSTGTGTVNSEGGHWSRFKPFAVCLRRDKFREKKLPIRITA